MDSASVVPRTQRSSAWLPVANMGTLNRVAAMEFGVTSRPLQKAAADHDVVIGEP
jgi:hypothetical protein